MARSNSAKDQLQQAQYICDDAVYSDGDKCLQVARSLSPTLGSFTWRKVMAVQMLPGAIDWTVSKMCRVAHVDRKSWYRITNNPDFGESFIKAQRQIKGKWVGLIFQAFIKKALFGGKDGYGNSANQLAFLRDVDLLKPDKSGDINVNVVVTQEQREEKLQKGLNRFAGIMSDN